MGPTPGEQIWESRNPSTDGRELRYLLKGSDSPQGNNINSRGPLLARRARVKPTGSRMKMNAALKGPNPSADGFNPFRVGAD